MQTANTLSVRLGLLSIGLVCLVCRTQAAATSTFQMQTRSTMMGTAPGTGPQGWASSLYDQGTGATKQSLQISCRGLATNQVYHLMASWGTNGGLMHLSDFMPNRSGAILMQYQAGTPRHFAGTNNPSQAWGMMGGWTNHMSWVLFPGNGTNWCTLLNQPTNVVGSKSDSNGMEKSGMMTARGGQDMGGTGGMMGGTGGMMGGMSGMMAGGWPAMTNWWAGMTNWPSEMADCCWDYTNMWNVGGEAGGGLTNWWGSLVRGGSHMMPLPASVNPVPVINALIVMDESLQAVISADLANPETFVYQARCEFTNQGILPGAKASLQATATQRFTRLALTATGLAPRTSYFLAINGASLTPVASDARGSLRMTGLPKGVTSIRGIGSVGILDLNHNTVLSTTLPAD